jgi:outer membrane protein, heavy metal efflux system
MRHEARAEKAMSPLRSPLTAFALALVGTFGCASSSIRSDVGRVRELTRVDRLARVQDADVDPVASADARRLLQAPLDADAAVRAALLNNRELRATLREMGIARGHLIQAGLLPNPIVEAELLPERHTPLELRVEYDLTHALLAPQRASAEEPGLEAARYRAAGAVIELGYRVRVAFYSVQSAEQRLAIAQQVLDGQAALRDTSRALLKAGNVTELDASAREADYERSRIRVAELELDVVTERERLQRLLGAHGADTAWKVSGELSSAPKEATIPRDFETRALRASLDLAETRQRLEGLARRAGVSRTSGWLPDVSIDVHALVGETEEPSGPAERDVRFGGGISVGVPLFDRHQGTTLALESEFDALMERFYGMAVDLRSAAREARSRVVSAHARARQYQDIIVPAEQRVTEQTLLQYNAMQLGIFELVAARRAELDGRLSEIETRREYWSAVAELDALAAGKRVTAAPRASSGSSSGGGERTGDH